MYQKLFLLQKRRLFRIKNRERDQFMSVQGSVDEMRSGRVVVSAQVEPMSDIWYYQDGLVKNKVMLRLFQHWHLLKNDNRILGLATWSWVMCVCCSWSQPWAFRSWATLSQDPRPFCGQRPDSPSRRGPSRRKASSTVLHSLAWCWMWKVRKPGLLRVVNESLQVTKSTQIGDNFLFLFLFLRWQNVRQGACGNNAREWGEAESTVGDRTAVKTSQTTWEIHWKPQLVAWVWDGRKLLELWQGCEWSHGEPAFTCLEVLLCHESLPWKSWQKEGGHARSGFSAATGTTRTPDWTSACK